MIQKIQKFGGAMFTPVLLFAFAGVIIGIGTLATTSAVVGDLAKPDHLWYQIFNVLLQGGWTVFNQLPLLFVVGLPIGMAKKQAARCAMEALVLYLTFHYFLSTILNQWGNAFGVDFSQNVGGVSGLTMIANIKTLDMGMIGALAISMVVIYLHNRFFDTKLPEWIGTFSGSTFICTIGFFVMIPLALLAALLWPKVQHGMFLFQGFMSSTGALGIWIFILLERLLIPFGLHHILYSPFYYDNILVPGGLYAYWATNLPNIAASSSSLKEILPEAGFTATGFSKIFGCPGVALAFYHTAKPSKKKKVLGLLIPITLTAILCGVTEPIEFTFLFIAPMLFVVHALLAACISTTMYLFGIVGIHSGGVIEMASLNWIPLMKNHYLQYLTMLIIGLVFMLIWYVVFKFLILKFNLKTPGREDDEEVKFHTKKEYREKNMKVKSEGASELILNLVAGLGGTNNILEVSNCMTRLRLIVANPDLVEDDKFFKSIGTHGALLNDKSVQIIIGMSVAKVREELEEFLDNERK